MFKQNTKFWMLSAFMALTSSAFTQDLPDADNGKKLFEANCLGCHAIDKKEIGPALRGIHLRRTPEWLVQWIRNNEKFRKVTKDPDAIALYNEYNGAGMTVFEYLTPVNVQEIVEYIKTAPEAPKTAVVIDAGDGTKKEDNTNLYILLTLVAILSIVLLILARVKNTLRRIAAEKNPEEYAEWLAPKKGFFEKSLPGKWGKLNPTVLTLFAIVIVSVPALYYGFEFSITEVAVQKGYAPKQPIAFSHQLHAGQLKMNCQYCHSSVEKSKQASIPALNTCMNCHKGVQLTEKYNGEISPEIKKIYTALDYNPEGKEGEQYGKNPRPVRWIRIHNLPDHAYFNHSQHVKVGKQSCQTCHGAIEKMEVVQQVNTLQMGWCIDCHRVSQVDVANNNYYKALHDKAKADIAKNNQSSKYFSADGTVKLTAAMNGGLECSKCHY